MTQSGGHLDRPLKVVLPAGLTVSALGLVLALLSVYAFHPAPSVAAYLKFAMHVLVAPIFLTFFWPSTHVGPGPLEISFAVAALIAVPVHPLVRREWARPVSLFGFLLWLLCGLLVVAAPA